MSQNRERSGCDWWCGSCGEQYDWREENKVLTIQESCRLPKHFVFKTHTPPPSKCDNKVVALRSACDLAAEGKLHHEEHQGEQHKERSGSAEAVHRSGQPKGAGLCQDSRSALRRSSYCPGVVVIHDIKEVEGLRQ